MENKLELRMYGFVPYNISEIQKGIQFGHAVVEYAQMAKKGDPTIEWEESSDGTRYKKVRFESLDLEDTYNDWADNWKTFIILNGGTTNHKTSLEDGLPFGTLNQHVLTLQQNGIDFATFNEPDLGDQLTAVVFIVDERVFNRKKYPDFEDWVIENYGDLITGGGSAYQIAKRIKESNSKEDQKVYQTWVKFVGGEKNVFLKEFLHPKNFKLA